MWLFSFLPTSTDSQIHRNREQRCHQNWKSRHRACYRHGQSTEYHEKARADARKYAHIDYPTDPAQGAGKDAEPSRAIPMLEELTDGKATSFAVAPADETSQSDSEGDRCDGESPKRWHKASSIEPFKLSNDTYRAKASCAFCCSEQVASSCPVRCQKVSDRTRLRFCTPVTV